MDITQDKLLKTNYKYSFPKELYSICLNEQSAWTQRSTRKELEGFHVRFPHKWFCLPRGNAIFKETEQTYIKNALLSSNEIFCSYLAKELDIECAKYDLAVYKNADTEYAGVVSYNFLKDNETLISSGEFLNEYNKILTLDSFEKSLNSPKIKDMYSFNKEEILFGLFKLIVFDYLISNVDRNPNNIGFIVYDNNNTKPTVKLSPVFDNENAFGMRHYKILPTDTDKSIINKHLQHGLFFNVFHDNYSENPYDARIQEAENIVKYAFRNAKYTKYLYNILKFSNIDLCFNDMQKNNIVLDNDKQEWYKKLFLAKKHLLQDAFDDYVMQRYFADKIANSYSFQHEDDGGRYE